MNCKFAINYQVNCRPYITVEVQKNRQLTEINHNQVDKWTIDPSIVLDVQIRSQFPKTLNRSHIESITNNHIGL